MTDKKIDLLFTLNMEQAGFNWLEAWKLMPVNSFIKCYKELKEVCSLEEFEILYNVFYPKMNKLQRVLYKK